jgi:hypothetical protein
MAKQTCVTIETIKPNSKVACVTVETIKNNKKNCVEIDVVFCNLLKRNFGYFTQREQMNGFEYVFKVYHKGTLESYSVVNTFLFFKEITLSFENNFINDFEIFLTGVPVIEDTFTPLWETKVFCNNSLFGTATAPSRNYGTSSPLPPPVVEIRIVAEENTLWVDSDDIKLGTPPFPNWYSEPSSTVISNCGKNLKIREIDFSDPDCIKIAYLSNDDIL